jgi:hypothetical protein
MNQRNLSFALGFDLLMEAARCKLARPATGETARDERQ